MTICEAICMADKLRPNDVDRKTKAFWLVRLDEQIRLEMGEKFRDRAECHRCQGPCPDGCGKELSCQLDVPAPYDELYLHYLSMRLDLEQGEIERYGNTARLFDEVYRRYGSFMTHTLFPQGVPALRL